jgi:hypothetical protein
MSGERIVRRPDILPEHANLGTNPNLQTSRKAEIEPKEIDDATFARRAKDGLRELERDIVIEKRSFNQNKETRSMILSKPALKAEERLIILAGQERDKARIEGLEEAKMIMDAYIQGKEPEYEGRHTNHTQSDK